MEQENEYADPLSRLIKYHEDISEYLEFITEAMGFLFDGQAWIKMEQIESFFKRNVTEHFKFEEEIVFPLVLAKVATPDSIKLILELQKEHGSILKELEEFQKIISDNGFPFDKEASKQLNVLGRKILDGLLPHASKEDDNLLPILKENTQIFNRHGVM